MGRATGTCQGLGLGAAVVECFPTESMGCFQVEGWGGLARGRRAEGQGERAFQREQPGGEREAALGELGFVECCWSLGRRRVGVGPGGSETVVSPGIKGNSRGRAGGSTGIGPCLPTRLWIL